MSETDQKGAGLPHALEQAGLFGEPAEKLLEEVPRVRVVPSKA
jgi:hypothetical protein